MRAANSACAAMWSALVTFDCVAFRGYMGAKLLLEDTLGLPVDRVNADAPDLACASAYSASAFSLR
jgi:hypothetical protein